MVHLDGGFPPGLTPISARLGHSLSVGAAFQRAYPIARLCDQTSHDVQSIVLHLRSGHLRTMATRLTSLRSLNRALLWPSQWLRRRNKKSRVRPAC